MKKDMLKILKVLFFIFCVGSFSLLISCEDKTAPAPVVPPQQSAGVKGAISEKKVTEVTKKTPAASAQETKSPDFPVGSEAPPDLVPYYDPKGRVDPFFPIIEEAPKIRKDDPARVERRTPQTPLEKVDLSQLKLVGIIGSSLGPSAVVEESSGRGYVVTVGTYMGINSGRVTTIDMDRIIVTEIVVDWTGEIREERRELKLQKPTGE